MWLLPRARTLDAIFLAWLLGSALAFALGMLAVVREAAPWRRWPLDYAWLKRGFGVALLFLTATLCSNAMTTVDRYIGDLEKSVKSLQIIATLFEQLGLFLGSVFHRLKGRTVAQCFLRDVLIVDLNVAFDGIGQVLGGVEAGGG